MKDNNLEVKFYKKHPGAQLPTWGSDEAACCDLYMPDSFRLYPGEMKIVTTGLVAIPPKGWHLKLTVRSSTPYKYMITLGNSVGTIDSDYIGPEDEIKMCLFNVGNRTASVERGTRLCQLELAPNLRFDIKEVTYEQVQTRESRGGFGTTGK